MTSNVLAIAFACAGAFVGHFGFGWLQQQGFYALILPGGLCGLAAGLVQNRSIAVAVVCALLGLAAGLLTEFHYAPFVADPSLGYFLAHVSELRPITLALLALGGLISFYVPFRRRVP